MIFLADKRVEQHSQEWERASFLQPGAQSRLPDGHGTPPSIVNQKRLQLSQRPDPKGRKHQTDFE